MEDRRVTVCITSCNRFELLCQTLDTFFQFNTYPVTKIIVIEDSGIPELKNKILDKYKDKITLIFNETNLGQVTSITKMYSTVQTPYIFHCEEDYYFYKSGFIEDSLVILENNPNIHQVWIRGNILKPNQSIHFLESEIHKIKNIEYKRVKSPNLGFWCGFSFNAGLRRLEDYKKMFPEGFSKFHNYENPFLSEVACNTEAMKQGYRACQLLQGYCDTNSAGSELSTYKKYSNE